MMEENKDIMTLTNVQFLRDTRLDSISLSCITTIAEYLKWYSDYGKDNKLDEQRFVLSTRSATIIRKRLIDDLTQGAVIPPIVLGIAIGSVDGISEDSVVDVVNSKLHNATIIDGMQRTEALIQACSLNSAISNNKIRVEFWLTRDSISLIYRMLVLNSGQTPWDTKRQLEVVYKSLLEEVEQKVDGIQINYKNDKKRRTDGGVYPASSIVELYMAFSSRKELVSTSDRLADEFTKLDIISLSGNRESADIFFDIIGMLKDFDIAVSRYKSGEAKDGIMNGMDLFTEMPSKVGFVVAMAQAIIGRPGECRNNDDIKRRKDNVCSIINGIVNKINSLGEGDQLCDFLSIDILNEKISVLDKKKIGNAQREYYKKAFSEMLEMKEVSNMGIVWQSV